MALILRRFAAHEFVVRRLCASDPEFRSLCEDYATALRALEHWNSDEVKAEDYRRLTSELEEEIREILTAWQKTGRRGGRP